MEIKMVNSILCSLLTLKMIISWKFKKYFYEGGKFLKIYMEFPKIFQNFYRFWEIDEKNRRFILNTSKNS